MKKLIRLLLFLAVVIYISFTVNAHPGRTDENGGHYDSSTGEYHYHHGYSEHQHIDGVCPYDYVDKTAENNKNDIPSSLNDEKGKHINSTTVSTSFTNSSDIKETIDYAWIYYFTGLLFAAGVVSYVIAGILNGNKNVRKRAISDKLFTVANIMFWSSLIIVFLSLYLGENKNKKYVYATYFGEHYHTLQCDYTKSWGTDKAKKMDLSTAIEKGLTPCNKCNP